MVTDTTAREPFKYAVNPTWITKALFKINSKSEQSKIFHTLWYVTFLLTAIQYIMGYVHQIQTIDTPLI